MDIDGYIIIIARLHGLKIIQIAIYIIFAQCKRCIRSIVSMESDRLDYETHASDKTMCCL